MPSKKTTLQNSDVKSWHFVVEFHRSGGHNCNCISLFCTEDLIFIVLYGNGILLQLDQIRGLLQLQQDCAREREEGGGWEKEKEPWEQQQESKAKQEEAALSTVASLSGWRRLQEGSSGNFVSNWREISNFWRF
jgi:hypothetical protein